MRQPQIHSRCRDKKVRAYGLPAWANSRQVTSLMFALLQQAAKLLAAEEIKIPLPPGSAPGVAFPRGGFHFIIVVSHVNHELSDPGLKIFQRRLVERSPLFRGNSGFNRHGMVNH